ncbi:hypothetical protein HDU99_001601 [Rhizoclosmatium hyalinum]|nr:hypothetical protein HDU99_001601 [Rhizoclosmatium hyalinum]
MKKLQSSLKSAEKSQTPIAKAIHDAYITASSIAMEFRYEGFTEFIQKIRSIAQTPVVLQKQWTVTNEEKAKHATFEQSDKEEEFGQSNPRILYGKEPKTRVFEGFVPMDKETHTAFETLKASILEHDANQINSGIRKN